MELVKILSSVIKENRNSRMNLTEISNALMNQLLTKFRNETEDSEDDIKTYINDFGKYQNGLPADKRDLTKYSYEQLKSLIVSDAQWAPGVSHGGVTGHPPLGDKLIDHTEKAGAIVVFGPRQVVDAIVADRGPVAMEYHVKGALRRHIPDEEGVGAGHSDIVRGDVQQGRRAGARTERAT